MAISEQVTAIGKAQVEAALRFAEIAAQGAEKITEINIKTAKAAFADGVKNLKALSEIRDVTELPGWAALVAQPNLDKATAYGKAIYEAAAATGSEIGTTLDQQIGEFTKQVNIALEVALKSAPAGSESAVAAVKSVIAVANDVYDNIVKATKQLASMTEANVAAAAQTGVARKKAA